MTHILQLPHLIKEKINDYLSFTKWRDKMSRVCIEYHQTYVYFEFSTSIKVLVSKIGYRKNYNYRFLDRVRDRELLYNDYVQNDRIVPICKLSPNY
ncbi:MAG: hypothetical protein WD512_12405 [Candidatus Paceibacterota bacterium]